MYRSMLALAALLFACGSAVPPEIETAAQTQGLTMTRVTREQIRGDVYHYGFVVPVGDGPNAQLHIHRVVRERAPWIPRPSTGAIMMLHGDFSNFDGNFLPSADGMAPWLAERGIDVWGFDRRWTQAPEGPSDLSDFDAMGVDQQIDDIGLSLGFARAIRLVTDRSLARMSLLGFSRGGMLAYFYASDEATRPSWQRHLKGLIPYDVYASLAPEDEDLRQFNCNNAATEYAQLAAGEVDVPNDTQIMTGRLALSAPDDQSPFFPPTFPVTNREWMLSFVGETYFYFGATPVYHLNAPVLDENFFVVGLTQSSETVVATWLANAVPHQSLRESADTDALVCGDAPLPADVPLSRIRIPLLLIGAAGGYGSHAIHSTTQVSSADVTTLVIRQLPVEREAEDFGHADLLFSPAAPALAWQPLLAWLQAH